MPALASLRIAASQRSLRRIDPRPTARDENGARVLHDDRGRNQTAAVKIRMPVGPERTVTSSSQAPAIPASSAEWPSLAEPVLRLPVRSRRCPARPLRTQGPGLQQRGIPWPFQPFCLIVDPRPAPRGVWPRRRAPRTRRPCQLMPRHQAAQDMFVLLERAACLDDLLAEAFDMTVRAPTDSSLVPARRGSTCAFDRAVGAPAGEALGLSPWSWKSRDLRPTAGPGGIASEPGPRCSPSRPALLAGEGLGSERMDARERPFGTALPAEACLVPIANHSAKSAVAAAVEAGQSPTNQALVLCVSRASLSDVFDRTRICRGHREPSSGRYREARWQTAVGSPHRGSLQEVTCKRPLARPCIHSTGSNCTYKRPPSPRTSCCCRPHPAVVTR